MVSLVRRVAWYVPMYALVLLFLLTIIGFKGAALGQPSFGGSCAPPNPSPGCPTPPKTCGGVCFGPVSVGQGQLYFEDKNHASTSNVDFNKDTPIYLVLVAPPAATNGFVAILQYFPPNYAVSNYLESPWQAFSGGGPKTFGGYTPGSADPTGKYAFKALLWYTDGAKWYYSEPVSFLDTVPEFPSLVLIAAASITVAFVVVKLGKKNRR
jgi:hypothetical protein